MSRRCISSRGKIRPSEFPIRFTSIFIVPYLALYGPNNTIRHSRSTTVLLAWRPSTEAFQLVNHPLDDRQPALPKFRIVGVEAKRFEQFRIVLCAASRKHTEVTIGETFGGVLVDRVERVHQAIAEGVRVNVERRVDEMRNVSPKGFVAGLQLDRRAEAFALHGQP